jgi:hypothetical protein
MLAAAPPSADHAVLSRQCAIRCGCVRDAAEALALLVCSDRVAADLRAALLWPAAYEMHILLREFVDIPPESEFRVVRTSRHDHSMKR